MGVTSPLRNSSIRRASCTILPLTMMKTRNCFLFLLFVFCLPVLLMGQSTNSTPVANPPSVSSATIQTSAPAAAPVQPPKTPGEFFARARQLSDLEAAGVPFHLKATFVATGDAEYIGNGTFEEWWQSKNVWRKEATLGTYKYVAVQNGMEKAASATMAYTPLRVRQAEGLQIFDIAPPKEKKPTKWKLTYMNLNGMPLNVLGAEDDSKDQTVRFPKEYSFTNDGLLWGYRYCDLYEKYSDFQSFENLQFPRMMTLSILGKQFLVVRVSTLEKLADGKSNRFDPHSVPDLGADLSRYIDLPRDDSSDITPPKLTHARPPSYPRSERESASEGTAVIRIVVDTKGHPREPYVLVSAGKTFDRAAIEAVRAYRFKPAMKDHQPVMTIVNVVVAFHIGRPPKGQK